MTEEDANYVELCERQSRQDAINRAVARVRSAMKDPESVMCRSWITGERLANKWLASDDPFTEFPENAEYWVANYYDKEMGWGAYGDHYKRYPPWPDTREWLSPRHESFNPTREGNLNSRWVGERPY